MPNTHPIPSISPPVSSRDVFFTAAIRTYNGATHISTILDRLKIQEGVEHITWEVLIVDNNSTDNTLAIVSQYQTDWPSAVPLRWVTESRQGASHARCRAIQEAQGKWIGFLDDDNWPDATWVAAICEFALCHPQAGAINGNIHGQFEVPPPDGFEKIAYFFPVLHRRNKRAFCLNDKPHVSQIVLPPGAGLAIRKRAWLECVPANLLLKGPTGAKLVAKGEDMEALSYLSRHRWEIWFNPEQNIEHYIPSSRFERAYLMRFFRGIGLSRYYLRMLGHPSWRWVIMLPLYFINDIRKMLVFWIKHRPQLASDVVLASQMQMLVYTLVSPFYLVSTYVLPRVLRRSPNPDSP